jgi:hypothetical protein
MLKTVKENKNGLTQEMYDKIDKHFSNTDIEDFAEYVIDEVEGIFSMGYFGEYANQRWGRNTWRKMLRKKGGDNVVLAFAS